MKCKLQKTKKLIVNKKSFEGIRQGDYRVTGKNGKGDRKFITAGKVYINTIEEQFCCY